MKRIFIFCTGLFLTGLAHAQFPVAVWDFNSGGDANPATGTTTPIIGVGSVALIGGVTSPSFNAGSPLDPNTTDNSGWQTTSYPAQGLNPKTAGIQINVNTTGITNGITLSFQQRLSNTAANTWVLQYTLDNSIGSPIWVDATTYTFVPQPTGTGDIWYSRSFNFSAIPALNNNPNVGFRIVTDFDPTLGTQYLSARSTSVYGTAGTCRFDLITVTENAGTVSFASAHQSVLENAGTVNAVMNITSPNSGPCKAVITTSVHTTATGGGVDYTVSNDTVTFPALSSASQNFAISINDDVIPENAEYVSFKIGSVINGNIGTNNFHILYIRDNDYTPPTPTNEVMLQLLSSYSTGAEGTNSAEIVAYDSGSQKLVTANSIANRLDIIDFSNPASPGPINSISLTALGGINSVDVRNGFIAVALQGTNPQDSGRIAFFDMTGALVSQVTVGAMPDMITYNHAGTKVYAPCEGEPTLATYAQDPEGNIAVVDISGGIPSVTNANVTLINFNSFDSQLATLRAAGVRLYGNNGTATVSQDLEPEYITISDDDLTAWVTLQEANAIAKLNLLTNTVTAIIPLGKADHSLVANGLDASDQTSGINIANFPVKGMYLPDAITHMNIGGTNYIFTANEGDARADFGALNNEESRISGLTLDPTVFVDQNILKSNVFLGRLNATRRTGDTDGDGDIDEINVYGSRGFSVWDENGVLLFNSGNLLEKIIANHPTFSAMFNASNTSGAVSVKNRSDDKGPEIEGVAVANIDGDHLLFASAERIGGVFIFNIDNPMSPRYVGYYNNRTVATNGPDRGAEGIIYISAEESPNGNPLLLLANEITSTLSIYQVNTCASLSGVNITTTPNDTICSGSTAVLNTTTTGTPALQWLNNNADIVGETGTSTNITTAGLYSLAVQNSSLLCADTTAQIQIVVNTLPTVTGAVTENVVCNGDTVVFTGSGATSYTWTNSVVDNTDFIPTITNTYTVTGTDANGCSNTSTVSVTVNDLPTVVGNVTESIVCNGDTIVFTGSGATSYTWTNSVVDNTDFIPTITNTYTVTGTDANGCSNTSTVSVTVNDLPTVVGTVTDNDICTGSSVTFTGSGAITYNWTGGVTDGSPFTPSATNTYTVTGTDVNACSNTSTVTVTVNNLPAVTFNLTTDSVCVNHGVLSLTGGSPAGGVFTGSGVTGSSFNPATGTGSYTITYTYTDANGCINTDTENLLVSGCLSIYNETIENVMIYPNPTESFFYIKTTTNDVYQLHIFDMSGKVVYTGNVSDADMIDVSNLNAGTYIVKLENTNGTFYSRLIKK